MTEVHVILPNDIDDPAAPSGGNTYDRRMCQGLSAAGWEVREHAVAGAWPRPRTVERAALAGTLAALPDGVLVLLDGLVASAVPEVLRPHARRLRLVILVHALLGDEADDAQPAEREALAAACALITTSNWATQHLLDLYGPPAALVHVAAPGVDTAPVAPGTSTGSHLICVAAITSRKGHDLLVEALASIADLPWTCVFVGSISRDPSFVELLRSRLRAAGLTDRVRFPGALTGADLHGAYADADLLVLASRGETYGMVITEALARGIPVVVPEAGGVPEALGHAPDGRLPGLLVEPGDAAALSAALRRWLTDERLRHRLRRSARERRAGLTGWNVTADRISTVLAGVANGVPR